MKKLIVCILLLFVIIAGGFLASYFVAEEKAAQVANSFPGSLGSIETQFALHGLPKLTPCWVMRSEYANQMTGATFDVYVSFWGKVLKVPPMSKMPN